MKIEDQELQNKTIDAIYAGNVPRAFFGRKNDTISVELYDKSYQPRLKMYLDQNGEPHIDFLNEQGEVTYSIPPKI